MPISSSQDPRALVPTKTPGVYTRGSRYVVIVRDADGKQRKKFCRTLAEARAKRAEMIDKAGKGEEITESKLTVRAYFESWIDSYAGRPHRASRSLADDGHVPKGQLNFFVGRARLAAST